MRIKFIIFLVVLLISFAQGAAFASRLQPAKPTAQLQAPKLAYYYNRDLTFRNYQYPYHRVYRLYPSGYPYFRVYRVYPSQYYPYHPHRRIYHPHRVYRIYRY